MGSWPLQKMDGIENETRHIAQFCLNRANKVLLRNVAEKGSGALELLYKHKLKISDIE